MPTFSAALRDHPDRDAWNEALSDRIAEYEPDLVVLAGFMRILGPKVVGRFRIVNTHPALLPAFPGAHAIRDALTAGVTRSGVTVHWVDEGVDTGPVIAQVEVPVEPGDDEDSLRARIQAAEKPLYVQAIRELTEQFMTKIAVRRALISVYDKTGLEDLARGLHEAGVEIVSTGSTAARIRDLGVPVTAVDEVTGFPEILGGRVKTLHPNVHAGLLADQQDPSHVATIEELGIAAFQLLVSNLYPFADTVASGASHPEVVEQIDIGGPAMVRASAKNHASIAVVTDPARYPDVLEAVRGGGFDLAARQALAVAAFRHTARYDIAVASWLGSVVAPDDQVEGTSTGFPGWIAASWERAAVLRYGENPHQRAALYVSHDGSTGLAQAELLSGKEMSYNNYTDADAAWRAAYDFAEPCVAIIKHANPVRARRRCRHRRGAPQGARLRPDQRVRRRHRGQRPDHERVRRPDREGAHRGDRRAGVRARRAGAAEQAQEHPAAARAAAHRRGGRDAPDLRRPAAAERRRHRRAGRRPGHVDARRRRRRRRRDARRPRVRLAGVPRGEVQRDRARPRRCDGRRRHGPGQPRRLVPARGLAGRRPRGGVGRRVRCVLPVRGRRRACSSTAVSAAIVEPGGSLRDDDTIAACKEAGVALYFTGTRHFTH